MCYGIVTKSLYSFLVFVEEGVVYEFYGVRYCKPRKYRYISVTFLGCLNRSGSQNKKERLLVQDMPLFRCAIISHIPILESDFLPIHHFYDFTGYFCS
jgi:hypothetical protein